MLNKIKAMVVDDTVIYRKIMRDVVSSMKDIEVIATAPNGDIALKKIARNVPDLVFLDVEMPVMDGLQTLEHLKKEYPKVGVIMVSGVNERQADITMKALSKGAIDFVTKPTGRSMKENTESLKKSLNPIVSLFRTKRATAGIRTPKQTTKRKIRPISKPVKKVIKPKKKISPKKASRFASVPNKFDVLVIGVSTGGPNALAKFIPLLDSDLNVPILLVQHMPPMFTKSLANHLNMKSKLKVIEAQAGMSLEKNVVYIAPGGKHMIIQNDDDNTTIDLLDTPPVNSCKPSVDVLFDSVPNVYKTNILSLIMTGMGADGANGIKTLKRIGTYTVTQSEDTCVVYGMPRAVVEAGLSDEIVPLDKLASRVTDLIIKGKK